MSFRENSQKFHGKTATITATATTKTKRMKNNQDAVTANPLGCGSLWKNKKTTTKTAPDCHEIFSKFLAMTATAKGNDNDWVATKILRIFSQ